MAETAKIEIEICQVKVRQWWELRPQIECIGSAWSAGATDVGPEPWRKASTSCPRPMITHMNRLPLCRRLPPSWWPTLTSLNLSLKLKFSIRTWSATTTKWPSPSRQMAGTAPSWQMWRITSYNSYRKLWGQKWRHLIYKSHWTQKNFLGSLKIYL